MMISDRDRLAAALAVIATIIFTGPACADEAKPLLFLCDQNYPPMTYQENGQPKGVVVDILRALEPRLGRKIEIRAMDWKDAQSAVAEGRADGLCQMSATEARQRLYDFSDPIVTSRFSIFSRSGRHDLAELADLKGLRVGVTAGGLPRGLVEADPSIHMIIIDDYLQGFRLLSAGQLDAVVGDQWVGSYLLADQEITDVAASEDSVARLPSSLAVRKGDARLLAALNQGLKGLKADGSLAHITATWRPKEVIFETREQARNRIYNSVVGALALLLMAATVLVIAMKREISARKRTEATLRENSALLAQSNADLEAFAYVASHDLQTPLRGMVSYAQLLERRYKGRIDTDADQFIGFIVDSGHHMTALIAGLLDYSRISSKGEPLRPVSAGVAIARALTNLKKELDRTGAEVSVGAMPVVMADDFHLVSLFQNLVGNGLKYCALDRKPKLSVTTERDGEGWRFAVRDNGVGIEPQYYDKIFEIFQRLYPTSGAEGTGIGLAMCRRIVNRFGGTIWVESKPGTGTTFFFTLRDGSSTV